MVQSTAFLKNSHFAKFYLRITFFYLFGKKRKKRRKKGQNLPFVSIFTNFQTKNWRF